MNPIAGTSAPGTGARIVLLNPNTSSGVIILAGAPLAGLAARVADRIPVPVVDGVAAAVKQAEALAALRPRKATAGTFRRPAPKPVTGVAPALERLMAGPSGGSN
jgi:allantoin racemase